MFKLNNKGQSLVMFILLLPILLFVMVLVIDIGSIIVEKQELNNINKMTIDYALDKIDTVNENDLIEIISLNTKNMKNISVSIDNGMVTTSTKKNVSGFMGQIFKIKGYEVLSTYQGSIVNNKKRIERVK